MIAKLRSWLKVRNLDPDQLRRRTDVEGHKRVVWPLGKPVAAAAAASTLAAIDEGMGEEGEVEELGAGGKAGGAGVMLEPLELAVAMALAPQPLVAARETAPLLPVAMDVEVAPVAVDVAAGGEGLASQEEEGEGVKRAAQASPPVSPARPPAEDNGDQGLRRGSRQKKVPKR